MDNRQTTGNETWFRLREWTKGQAPSERLAAQILIKEGYSSIDPSHPLGGPDGLKDVVCKYDNQNWIGATYFPRGQQTFNDIKSKFEHDLAGVNANNAVGIAFVTNQELTLSEREEIKKNANNCRLNLFHLERLSTILNNPAMYGVRLEFLDIEMTKEEQLAFISAYDQKIENLQISLGTIQRYFEETGSLNTKKLDEIFNSISAQQFGKSEAVSPQYVTPNYGNSYSGSQYFYGISNLHTCSYCKYGYLINRNMGYSTGYLGSAGNNTITCPKCGNTEDLGLY